MILNYFDFTTSMGIALALILAICAIILLLAWRGIRKIPMENLRERLACAIQYSLALMPCLYVLNMGFQNLPYLSELNDFDTPQSLFKTYHKQIEHLQIAHFTLYYTLLFAVITVLNLLKIALKTKN